MSIHQIQIKLESLAIQSKLWDAKDPMTQYKKDSILAKLDVCQKVIQLEQLVTMLNDNTISAYEYKVQRQKIFDSLYY